MSSPPSPNAPLILEAQADFALNLLREVSTDDRAPESEVHKYFGALLKSVTNGTNSSNTLETANKVYVKKGSKVKDAFKEQIEGNYGGQFETVDFVDGKGTAEKINNFVKEATHKKIRDLVKPDNFDKNTRLVLINALYFKGTWADKFDSKFTKKSKFHVDAKNFKELEMMHLEAYFIYYKNAQVEKSMFVLLPKERFGLTELLAQLDGKKLLKLIKKRDKENVKVVLPKFKLEATHELNKPLTNMGMPTAFTISANFEGISGKKTSLLSKVMQKAVIEVNEEGTVAAAVTEGVVADCASSKEYRFVADRPFCAFLIRDDTVLFSVIFRK
ncbi:hypothetical protein niasHT_017130 [Heterodera trifolii]|uniref:Serpin domain-containing protein n=1 Tax=Heterodera trifolii TaxID=157864 RepID=A0ABD2LGT0_9BILA